MTSTVCKHCGAETSNGLVLCQDAQTKAKIDLDFLPIYFRNLARWQPGRAGTRQVPTSSEPRGERPVQADRVFRALDKAGLELTGWVDKLARAGVAQMPEQSGDEAENIEAVCKVLAKNLATIGAFEWAGQFVTDLAKHERQLRELTEEVVPGWYAGACKRCEAPTFVVPGLTWVTCPGCGATTYARDHLDTVLDEAKDWVARPMRLAEAVVALVDTELSVARLHKRISKWGERGFIEVIRDDEWKPKQFRLGDVLTRLDLFGETRLGDDPESRAS